MVLFADLSRHWAPPQSRGTGMDSHIKNATECDRCDCCPYGYHIHLDFVRYCENLALVPPSSPTPSELRRKRRRKQRQSMEMLLGLLPPLPQTPASRESYTTTISSVPSVPVSIFSYNDPFKWNHLFWSIPGGPIFLLHNFKTNMINFSLMMLI